MRSLSGVVLLVAYLAQAQAQFLVNELSFGYGNRIAPEGTQSIPGFSLQGTPADPELLSNKVILTAPAPGNMRGAVWSDRKVTQTNWIADVEFRANGPERGGGNLNIWLARDGSHVIGANSIYTTGIFEGLALVIDQHGGTGGMLRGFLNDGTKQFNKVHNVDALAFGHCSFSYRNLGRPSQVKLRHTQTSFKVEIDGNLCFESDKIRLPTGYNFGLTAASADTPDSFEVFKLVVLTEDGHAPAQQQSDQKPVGGQGGQQNAQGMFSDQKAPAVEDTYEKEIPDESADRITGSAAQFADLHNRLQSVNHHLSTLFRQFSQQTVIGEKRHEEMSVMIGELKGLMNKLDKFDGLSRKVEDLEREMRTMRNDLGQRLRDSENSIKYHVADKHASLADHITDHANAAPGHTRLIVVIIGSQLVLVGAYVLYKRRKSMPKKYL